jgi:hypothetical protein
MVHLILGRLLAHEVALLRNQVATASTLISPNGRYRLQMQDDNNLVIYDLRNNTQAVWNSHGTIMRDVPCRIRSFHNGVLSDRTDQQGNAQFVMQRGDGEIMHITGL